MSGRAGDARVPGRRAHPGGEQAQSGHAGGGQARDRAPRVIIADDHGMIREGLRMILEVHGIEVVGEAADGASAVGNARALRPDVVLMDLRMPGIDGVEATRQIVAEGTAEVLVLTSFDEDALVFAAIGAGAAGFLLKTTEGGALVDAVRRVAAGEGVLDPRVTRRALAAVARDGSVGGAGGVGVAGAAAGGAAAGGAAAVGAAGGAAAGGAAGAAAAWPARLAKQFPQLTARECEVLDALCAGDSNASIATALGVSVPTVKTHVSNILVKLGAESRTHAAAIARSGEFG
ncbi:MAG: response regulator [Leucobacter sp.]